MEHDGLLSGIRSSVNLRPANQSDSMVQGSSHQGLYPNTQGLNGDSSANPSEPKVSFSPNEATSSVTIHYSPSGRRIKAQPSCRSSLYFHDGVRSVDFVLVWDDLCKQAVTLPAEEKRRVFEKNLEREGLDLEYEKREPNGLNFIKIHAPLEVLRRYSEILKMRMPMRAELCQIQKDSKMNPLLHATQYLSQKVAMHVCLFDACFQ